MASTVITGEFGTIHQHSSVVKNSEACVLKFFRQMENLTEMEMNGGILVNPRLRGVVATPLTVFSPVALKR